MAFNYAQLKVMIADDSRQMRGLVRTFLEALNIKRVEVASDAEEASSAFVNVSSIPSRRTCISVTVSTFFPVKRTRCRAPSSGPLVDHPFRPAT